MKPITAYKSENGVIESSAIRATAHDIAHAFERAAKSNAIGTSSTGSSRIDWHAAMEILKNVDMLQGILDAYRGYPATPAGRKALEEEG